MSRVQLEVWGRGPGQEPWEVYVVKADTDTLSVGSALAAMWALASAPRPDWSLSGRSWWKQPVKAANALPRKLRAYG